ncbi:MAG: hypothetical protein BWY74_01592 [Firmicutes bacterium ADurb.Bin419]|nr:MAG: hypothetical protein BWY74_01592 [Firmicutes bacterium ADurb.Bin419]
MAFVLITACSPQKKIERSKQIVLTNKPAFDSVGMVWSQLHPCVSDTVMNEITDTIYGENAVFIDTVYIPKENIKYIYKTITKPSTIIEKKTMAYVTDYRQVNLLKEQLKEQQIKNNYLLGNVDTKELLIKEQKKIASNRLYYIIGLIIALIASHILRSKIKL